MAAVVFNSLSLLHRMYCLLKPYPTKTKYGLPLPPQCHVEISDEEIQNRPIMIIGDIHGCYDELESLINQAQSVVNSSDIYFIFVGDMINKGPKNLEVLTLIRNLTNEGKAAAVKGNHEESLLREYRSMSQSKDYILSPKYKYLTKFSADDFNYLQNLPYSLTIPKINSIVVHAGLVPDIPLKRQCLINLSHMRNIVYNIQLWGQEAIGHSKVDKGVAWTSMWRGPQHVYYGHDALRGLQDLPYSTGLDTGCVYGLRLTGILIDPTGERQFLSVPANMPYYSS